MPGFEEVAAQAVANAFAALSEAATYTPPGGDAFAIRVRPHSGEVDDEFGPVRAVRSPRAFLVQVSDLANPVKGGLIRWKGRDFQIKDAPQHPDRLNLKWLLGCDEVVPG